MGPTRCRTSSRAGSARSRGSKILVSLLLPFGAYLLAEAVGASGILAAVAAGITMAFAEQTGRALPTTRIRRTAVWDMVQFALNGAMFVVLGEQFRLIAAGRRRPTRAAESARAHRRPHPRRGRSLIVLRYLWVHVSSARAGAGGGRAGTQRLLLVGAFAGVRGSITLAGMLTLPLASARAFPARDVAIVIAAGVVILSIAIAGIVLPRLLAGMVLPPEEEDRALRAAGAQGGGARRDRRGRERLARGALGVVEHRELDGGGGAGLGRLPARIDGIARSGEAPRTCAGPRRSTEPAPRRAPGRAADLFPASGASASSRTRSSAGWWRSRPGSRPGSAEGGGAVGGCAAGGRVRSGREASRRRRRAWAGSRPGRSSGSASGRGGSRRPSGSSASTPSPTRCATPAGSGTG